MREEIPSVDAGLGASIGSPSIKERILIHHGGHGEVFCDGISGIFPRGRKDFRKRGDRGKGISEFRGVAHFS